MCVAEQRPRAIWSGVWRAFLSAAACRQSRVGQGQHTASHPPECLKRLQYAGGHCVQSHAAALHNVLSDLSPLHHIVGTEMCRTQQLQAVFVIASLSLHSCAVVAAGHQAIRELHPNQARGNRVWSLQNNMAAAAAALANSLGAASCGMGSPGVPPSNPLLGQYAALLGLSRSPSGSPGTVPTPPCLMHRHGKSRCVLQAFVVVVHSITLWLADTSHLKHCADVANGWTHVPAVHASWF